MRVLIIRNIAIEGPGILEGLLARSGWTVDLRAMDAGHELPPGLREYDAMVVLGGPMNVYEEDAHPYLRQVNALLKEAFGRDMAVLGICLGAQLMAKALGASVTGNPVKEIGWYTVTLTEAGRTDSLFAGLDQSLPVFQWHGDTFGVPSGAVHLAEAPACRSQAFRYGRAGYAFQFHLEVTPTMIQEWLEAYADELAAFGAQPSQILSATGRMATECANVAEVVLSRWLSLAR